MTTETQTKVRKDLLLDDRDLINLPCVQNAIQQLGKEGIVGRIVEVTFRVPGGGDWSGMDASINSKNPVRVVIEGEKQS